MNPGLQSLISYEPTGLLHKPPMTGDQRLPGQSVALETGKEQRHLSDILHRCEFTVDGLTQHDLFNHIFFADTQRLRLFRDLFIDQGSTYKAGADDITGRIISFILKTMIWRI